MKKVIAVITMLFSMAQAQVFFAPGPLAVDGKPLELGMNFRPVPGSIFTGVRFYKPDNINGYTVSLWDSLGNRLFTAPVGTPKGWTQVPFPAIQLPAGRFCVSFYTPTGSYTAKSGYFTADSTFPLMVVPKGGGTFLYAAGGGFPKSTFNNANYFVEPVLFPPGSSITGQVDTIRVRRDTTQMIVYRDTCRIDYSKIADMTFYVAASDSVAARLPDSTLLFRAIFGVDPPNFGSGDILYTYYPKTAEGVFRVRLYRKGWTVELKQPDGTWKPYKP